MGCDNKGILSLCIFLLRATFSAPEYHKVIDGNNSAPTVLLPYIKEDKRKYPYGSFRVRVSYHIMHTLLTCYC